MSKKNYYEILNIDRNATEEEVKKSYKKLALLHHPDRNQGNPESSEKFKEVNEAYSVLSSKDKRSQYDMMGHVDSSFDGEDPFSVFNNIFQQHMGSFMNMRYDNDINLGDMFGNITGMQQGGFPFGNVHVRVHTFPNDISNTREEFDETPNINNIFKNIFKEKKSTKIINTKPEPIIYNLNVSFSDIYNKKTKKITITRTRKKNGDYSERKKKIEIPIYSKEILLEGDGNELKNYNEKGDVIINIYNDKEDNFKRVNEYDLLTFKDITIDQFYSAFTYNLTLPNNDILKVQTEKMKNKEILIQRINKKGLPNDNIQGNLYVIYKIIFPETIDEVKNIKIESTTETIDNNYVIAYNCDFDDIFQNE